MLSSQEKVIFFSFLTPEWKAMVISKRKINKIEGGEQSNKNPRELAGLNS